MPIAIGILVGLFAIQATGTARVGALFGPIMLLYFLTISVLGVMHIAGSPWIILETINPLNAVHFFLTDGWRAFLALGSVVLAVTGAEALYADMGHFGRKPIGVSWLFFVMPALMLNYMGQGAMILSLDPAAADATLANPFFFLAPESDAAAARHPRHLRHHHRQPGGDFRRLLGDPAGDASGLHPAPPHPAHQRSARWARSTSRWSTGR